MAKSMKHKRGLKGNKKSMRKIQKSNGKRKMLRSSHKSTTKDKRKGNHKVNSKYVTKKTSTLVVDINVLVVIVVLDVVIVHANVEIVFYMVVMVPILGMRGKENQRHGQV